MSSNIPSYAGKIYFNYYSNNISEDKEFSKYDERFLSIINSNLVEIAKLKDKHQARLNFYTNGTTYADDSFMRPLKWVDGTKHLMPFSKYIHDYVQENIFGKKDSENLITNLENAITGVQKMKETSYVRDKEQRNREQIDTALKDLIAAKKFLQERNKYKYENILLTLRKDIESDSGKKNEQIIKELAVIIEKDFDFILDQQTDYIKAIKGILNELYGEISVKEKSAMVAELLINENHNEIEIMQDLSEKLRQNKELMATKSPKVLIELQDKILNNTTLFQISRKKEEENHLQIVPYDNTNTQIAHAGNSNQGRNWKEVIITAGYAVVAVGAEYFARTHKDSPEFLHEAAKFCGKKAAERTAKQAGIDVPEEMIYKGVDAVFEVNKAEDKGSEQNPETAIVAQASSTVISVEEV